MAHNSEQGNDLHESLIDFVHPSSTVLCPALHPVLTHHWTCGDACVRMTLHTEGQDMYILSCTFPNLHALYFITLFFVAQRWSSLVPPLWLVPLLLCPFPTLLWQIQSLCPFLSAALYMMIILSDLNVMATGSFSMQKFRYVCAKYSVVLHPCHVSVFALVLIQYYFPSGQAFLNVEWTKRDTPQPKYSQVAAVAAIQRLLPFTDLKKTKLVIFSDSPFFVSSFFTFARSFSVRPRNTHHFSTMQILLPVMHQHHWSVYCVNFDQSRIDILDSMDHNFNCNSSWDMFHSHMGKKIMHRLSDALSNVAPHKFKSFKNWRHVQVQVPVQKDPSDSIFFAMKFLEFYDGEGHGALKTNFDTVSISIRFLFLAAFYLLYMAVLTCLNFLGSI